MTEVTGRLAAGDSTKQQRFQGATYKTATASDMVSLMIGGHFGAAEGSLHFGEERQTPWGLTYTHCAPRCLEDISETEAHARTEGLSKYQKFF